MESWHSYTNYDYLLAFQHETGYVYKCDVGKMWACYFFRLVCDVCYKWLHYLNISLADRVNISGRIVMTELLLSIKDFTRMWYWLLFPVNRFDDCDFKENEERYGQELQKNVLLEEYFVFPCYFIHFSVHARILSESWVFGWFFLHVTVG